MITPAFIDLHVHLREPGQTAKGDIAHETAAANAGGFGTILAMANTTPAIDSPESWLQQQKVLEEKAVVRVIQCAAMTLGRDGKVPVDVEGLAKAGVTVLSDDGTTPEDLGVMREVAARAHDCGLLMVDHCEDAVCSRRSEIDYVERDIMLAAEYGVRFHLQHLSTAEAVELVRQAQKDGLPVSGEATPHHLAFNADAVTKWGTNAKMAPPLRLESDRLAMIAGVADGTLAAIATDHAPHTTAEKARPFDQAPNGILGIEAALPVCYAILVRGGHMTTEAFLERLTVGPAKILGIDLPQETIELDLESPNVISMAQWKSMARNSPYEGFPGWGKVIA